MDTRTFDKILMFSGTSEGHIICRWCDRHGINIDVCVATEYGRQIIEQSEYIRIYQGRLDKREMRDFIVKGKYTVVIDATHPYAEKVTENIKAVCKDTGVEYIRVAREENVCAGENVYYADNIESAVEILNGDTKNVLVTTGSKELFKYKKINDITRVFARVLPTHDALEKCAQIKLPQKNVICMQGPFSKELNIAMLKQLDCGYMVTKSSGRLGGFDEKIQACAECDVKVIVIKRPNAESGISAEKLIEMLVNKGDNQKSFSDFRGYIG